jgi:hypothetical protein
MWATMAQQHAVPGVKVVMMGLQPMEIFVDDEAKLTLHGLVQHYIST